MADTDFVLTSTAFEDGGPIPARYTCDGENVSPELSWSGAPEGTQAFALVVDDPDARDFVHWVVYNLTGSQSGGLAEGVSASPDAPPQGLNEMGEIGWFGPCPPQGEHRYRFRLLALSEPLELPEAPTASEVLDAAAGRVLGEAVLIGTYRRQGR